jgi:starch phosphorylase
VTINTRKFVVVPALPEALEPLRKLAYNLWWSWNPPAAELFRRLDPDLWDACHHNPVVLLSRVGQERLSKSARDDAYAAQLCRVMDSFVLYLEGKSWFQRHYPNHKGELIAYFSAEFGIHESVPIYAGGLGVLAGDHLKSASDLGIPLVGVGLMYRNGYFEQQFTQDGQQLEVYPAHDFHEWPARLVQTERGEPLKIVVHYGDRPLAAQVWTVQVGRVRLILLDADIPDNPPDLRTVTWRLYGGDSEMRIRQEILLGIGGLRALRAMGIKPAVCHMNEGHAAFLALERIRLAMVEQNLTYPEAREAVAAGNLFTTHTPVPAGIDRFDPALVESHLSWMPRDLGITRDEFLGLGREDPARSDEEFCMAILALRLSYRSNGVSKLHGEVSRNMFQGCWPGVPRDEIPITHVTNGIHTRSWVSAPIAELYEQYWGPTWAEDHDEGECWKRVDEIPDPELWRVHERRRERLVTVIRKRYREELRRRGAPPAEIKAADEVLDPKALTIGFARRFAPYKRATLLLRNPERLAALLGNVNRPVQFIFAGKAHPKDAAGKELIKLVALAARRPEFRRRLILLENYDIDLARTLVQGVDVWLNNPMRPLEASGTSGMKVSPNGGLNLSCLDGWWAEGYNGENGWAIGDGRVYDDAAYRDHVESESLYNLLETEVVPLFYDRTDDGVPRKWVARVKNGLRTICSVFNTNRMLREYVEKMYAPALARFGALNANDCAAAKALAAEKAELRSRWSQVRITELVAEPRGVLKVGDSLPLRARVHLGNVPAERVLVEVYYGPVAASGEIEGGHKVALRHVESTDGQHLYEGAVPCESSGQYAFAVRVVPNQPDQLDRYDQGLIVWG